MMIRPAEFKTILFLSLYLNKSRTIRTGNARMQLFLKTRIKKPDMIHKKDFKRPFCTIPESGYTSSVSVMNSAKKPMKNASLVEDITCSVTVGNNDKNKTDMIHINLPHFSQTNRSI